MGIEGRWTINRMALGLGWNASIGGPITDSLPVPVVPCDDAAVERVAEAVEREMDRRSGGDAFLYEMDDDVRQEFLRAVAEAVLRAAGGQDGV